MIRKKILHEILSNIFSGQIYNVSFDSATDNLDNTFTLNGVCDFHHAQPGFSVSLDGKTYTIINYNYSEKTILLSGFDPITVKSFDLYTPYFFHGSVIQQENELKKIDDMGKKTPMIYLMEPYDSNWDLDVRSTIDQRPDVTLCFLTQADTDNWLTDDFYHNAIYPMKNLFEDTMQALKDSLKFNTIQQRASPIFYTRFGFNIKDSGTQKLWFAEKLSGIGVSLNLEVFKEDVCQDCD